ncbi:HotDog domain-containing protein [Thermothelomyces heterothallicus CBS 202.75]|uniref:HotDog domain-containing protein n=1 Tax=Thermothelomyces heterothallicus CBS 202.75 TaxID=1149848 RepID=UPI003743F1CE
MGSKIQYCHLLRLVRRQQTALPARFSPTAPSLLVSRFQHLQPFSTSPSMRQEQRHEPSQHSALGGSAADSTAKTAAPTGSPPTIPPSPPPPPTDPSLPAGHEQQQQEQQSTKKKKKRPPRQARGRLFLALASTLVGLSLGSAVRVLVSPPNPPEPNTEEDEYTIRIIREQAAKLPIVQQMTGDPEQWEWWDAYESLPAEHRAQHISASALAGSRGVGAYQRVFCNRSTGELVSVIHFGSATTSWPGVVHGGCLATILDESCGRAAFRDPEWGGRVGLTARLTLEYKKPTLANNFYVIRARVRPDEELPESERGKRHYKCWIDASIEDARTGTVTVTAEALFVGGKGNGKTKKSPLGGDEARQTHVKF